MTSFNLKKITSNDPDLTFAILLSALVFAFFSIYEPLFFNINTGFAIMERFAVLGLVGLALTLCIIAGEIGLIQGFFIAYLKVRAIVLTVGTLMLLRGITLFAADEKTVMLTDFDIPDFIQEKMFYIFSPASFLVLGIFVLVALFMRYTKYGREVYAIGGARKEAVASGVSLKRPMMIVFAISGLCAGIGGAIIGLRSGTAQPLGLQYLLLAATVAAFIGGVSVLGGKGGVVGAFVGVLTVNFLNTGLVFNVTPAYIAQMYMGGLLLVVILFQNMSKVYEDKQQRQLKLADTDSFRQRLLKSFKV